ncbi:trypsin-like peptidase domain-containing protein [Candidatus Pacearchaeota archaeon]|nr:trypsin-like peptidase domain-containing protein [Candidatus Pacearchaeota archaeon]
MALQTHHKWIIGSFTTLVVIFMISSSVFMYLIFAKQELNYRNLDQKITEVQADSQSKINDLTESISETNEALNRTTGSLKNEISSLKASASADFSGIIEDVITGVVTIKTDVSQGTGFIITGNGYVVTNYHVMKNAKAAVVITSDGKNHGVQSYDYNEVMDIALIKMEGSYDYLKLDDSENVQVGEKVIAIGNPLGLQFSVSEGIVSAVHREGQNGLEAYIQTDAALNPGNSGGPLINKKGKVIGINNFKVGGGENLGFALESNYMRDAVNAIALQGLNETLV